MDGQDQRRPAGPAAAQGRLQPHPVRRHLPPAQRAVATPLLRGLEEDGLCRCCHLSPFTKDETMEFIQLYGAQSLPQADKERIYQDTQGNAFLLTQLIGSIMENGRPTVLPRNMEEILSYRLSVSPTRGFRC